MGKGQNLALFKVTQVISLLYTLPLFSFSTLLIFIDHRLFIGTEKRRFLTGFFLTLIIRHANVYLHDEIG